jgi:hypothetical protein
MKKKVLAGQSILKMTENRAKGRQVPGQSPSPVPYRTLCSSLVLIWLIAAAGCGRGSGFNPNQVSVSVAPATATVSVNGQVPLQAMVRGLCSGCGLINFWTVTEDPAGSDCATLIGIQPPGPCPAGSIQFGSDPNGLTVTYIAPSVPGTYHVNAEWEDFVNFSGPPVVTKTGTSAITVSP